jgi:Putative phage holin Dp-1
MSHSTETPVKNPMLSDEWYKRLEYIARVILPALATLYLALSTLWKLPAGPEVVGTIVALDTFLGLFIGYAQKSYDASDFKYDGSIDVAQNPEGAKVFSLNLNGDPLELEALPKVTFKVNTQQTS